MHVEREKAIKKKITELLSKTCLNSESNNFINDEFISNCDALYTLCKKEKEYSYLSHTDLIYIVLGEIIQQSDNYEKKQIKEKDLKTTITKNLMTLLLSLPIKYEIKLDIPIFYGNKDFTFNNIKISLSLEKIRPKKTGLLEDYLSQESKNKETSGGLTFKIEGYLGNKINQTFKTALSYIKLIIQRGISNQIIIISEKTSPFYLDDIPSVLYEKQDLKHIPHYALKFKPQNSDQYKKISLPDDLSIFFDKLELNLNDKKVHAELEKNSPDFLKNTINEADELFYSTDENCRSIKSAIEWYIDACANEERNISISFLQICFGLEALFSDDSDLIRKTISLKCAYSIARSAKERIIFIDLIKDIYDLRCKIVHGSKLGIDDDHLSLYERGKLLLKISIDNELTLALNKK